MKINDTQLRDSPFGYNDELAYAILDDTINAGDYVLGHIQNYNFSGGNYLYNNRFQHEFGHLILGLSFLKNGSNQLPFEYAYDGNYMAEAMVLEIEDCFSNIYFETICRDKDKFINKVDVFYTDRRFVDARNSVEAVHWMDNDSSLKRAFDARRKLHFDNNDMIRGFEIESLLEQYKGTELEASIYHGQDIPRSVVESFHEDVQPIIRLIERNFRRLVKDDSLEIEHNIYALRDYLKIIPVHMLWDVMNNPELAETIDLDHRELMTWEFAMFHDQNMKHFIDFTGFPTAEIRSTINNCENNPSTNPYDQCVEMDDGMETFLSISDTVFEKASKAIIPFGENNTGQKEWKIWKENFARTAMSCLLKRGVNQLPASVILSSVVLSSKGLRTVTPSP